MKEINPLAAELGVQTGNPCPRCGTCTLYYPLASTGELMCCRCYPNGHRLGWPEDGDNRFRALFPWKPPQEDKSEPKIIDYRVKWETWSGPYAPEPRRTYCCQAGWYWNGQRYGCECCQKALPV